MENILVRGGYCTRTGRCIRGKSKVDSTRLAPQ
jgi:hypothetical protein